LGIGVAAGFGLLSALLLAMSLFGGYSFGDVALAPAQGVEYGTTYLIVFAFTAVSEEGPWYRISRSPHRAQFLEPPLKRLIALC
jgi:hypothetical protein